MYIRRFTLLLAATLLIFSLPSFASAVAGPSLAVQVGSDQFLFGFETEDGKAYSLRGNGSSADYSFTIEASANEDPFLTYHLIFSNFTGADLSIVLTIGTPYFGGPYNSGNSQFTGTLTDANSSGDGHVIVGVNGIHYPTVDGNPFGAYLGGCSITDTAGFSDPCGNYSASNIAISTAPGGVLQVINGFTLSTGDTFDSVGMAEITNAPPVPEPASMFLLGSGLAGIAMRIRRQRK